ncbi:actin-related protein 2/3 complex subunit 3-like [Octopus sinensis]|nr:actin-related protein 2/3 complex subunit 3-like [Octopus sinensis]
MPAFNCPIKHDGRSIGDFAIMPLKTNARGPAPIISNKETEDIVDVVISYFRPNVLHKLYEIESHSDRTFIYGILYVSECIKIIAKQKEKSSAVKQLNAKAVQTFSIPGDSKFPLNSVYKAPSSSEKQDLRDYIMQMRIEIGQRLVDIIYKNGPSEPSKVGSFC